VSWSLTLAMNGGHTARVRIELVSEKDQGSNLDLLSRGRFAPHGALGLYKAV
jgi:hypothetical protein